jgi:methylthioribose-1-phosphate isomerase
MKVNGQHYHTIWVKEGDDSIIQAIDQRLLPHQFEIVDLKTCDDIVTAIKDMVVRGAPLIGVTAAYGMYLAALGNENLQKAAQKLNASRPTAVNLTWAVNEQLKAIEGLNDKREVITKLLDNARRIKTEDIVISRKIGEYGLSLIEAISQNKNGETVNVLTHCNAGWLATIDWGTATSPIYHAFEKGIKVHVWVDETRPRNQGANLTAFELNQHGIPHTVISDNTGGHLMQHGMVDMAIVGTDRTSIHGDVANKIGTYLKALAAYDNNIPFYVALPSTTIDWDIKDGLKEIPIETRSEDEVKYIQGKAENGALTKVLLTPESSNALNVGFDVTPARLVTGLITERGICNANEEGIFQLFPEKK